MRALALLSAVGLALTIPTTSLAADAAERAAAASAGKVVARSTTRAINNQAAISCNLCFTCGGDWPVFAGAWSVSPANPTERGSGCSGALTTRTDSRPFICCN